MAQALAYLGVAVTVVEQAEQVLVREDRELADLLSSRLSGQGIRLRMKTKAVKLADQMGAAALTVEEQAGKRDVVVASAILVAVGRKANVDGLGLEAAGVEYSAKGIKTDGRLRTTAGNIYACGDVAGPYQFSHMAEYQARIAARNALFPLKGVARLRSLCVVHLHRSPDFAHAGLTEGEARQAFGERIKVFKWQYKDTDRARTEAEPFGMGKFVCDDSYRLLGAHILGQGAGDLIHEAQILKTFGIPFHRLDSVIHVYPTLSDVVRQPAKMSRIERLQGMLLVKAVKGLLRRKPTSP